MKTNTILGAVVVALFLPSLTFAIDTPAQPVETEAPMVSVRTSSASRKDVAAVNSDGWSQAQTVRSIGAFVDYHFFQARKTPFEIQCFFVAKNDTTKNRYVYDTALLQTKVGIDRLDFSGAPLMGTGKQWLDIPLLEAFLSGAAFTGILTSSNEKTGSHVEGWIVRFVSGGKVLTVNSNQQYLSDQAKQMPEFYNAVADAARKAKAIAIPPR